MGLSRTSIHDGSPETGNIFSTEDVFLRHTRAGKTSGVTPKGTPDLFYQGLIQTAVGPSQLETGNRRGAKLKVPPVSIKDSSS